MVDFANLLQSISQLSPTIQPPQAQSALPPWLNQSASIAPAGGDLAALLGGGQQQSSGMPGGMDLAALLGGQQAPANVMQLATGAPPNEPFPSPMQTQAPQPEVEAPRKRRSFLDTVGRISDVLAKVGGAEALYQPTLDARQDRDLALGDHTRKVDLEALNRVLVEQQIATGGMEVTEKGNAVLGQAVRGLQAIQARGGDISRAWPILAKQAGIDDERAAALGQIFVENPEALSGFATMLGAQKEFGLQPFYAQGSDGKLQAFQLGKDGTIQQITLPEGSIPSDPVKFIDVGGSQVGVGTRTGNPVRILPKTEAPGKKEDRKSREDIAREGNDTRITIAGMKGDGKAGAGSAGMVATAQGNIDELKQIYSDLKKMGAMVTPGQSSGANVAARVRASGVGQLVEGAVGTEAQTLRDRINSIRPGLMQSIARATGMTSRQLDSNADVKLFMQTVTDPTSSFEANQKAIEGLERFLKSNAKETPAATPGRQNSAPRRGGKKPTVTNW